MGVSGSLSIGFLNLLWAQGIVVTAGKAVAAMKAHLADVEVCKMRAAKQLPCYMHLDRQFFVLTALSTGHGSADRSRLPGATDADHTCSSSLGRGSPNPKLRSKRQAIPPHRPRRGSCLSCDHA